ncbi:hypothetical protein PROFUN_11223 [Planoprotostelium fungivorum]|uniref:PiggyBac transposable element-derived protein domain-containing protein n=1 Tax=Planoprotostelium fungivorum TaxID=1890364 RepID=A0A2P6NA23_9EUKA|nr:hypothetical protein PROFUN_11223 [Planoprotostelium fungivorum]
MSWKAITQQDTQVWKVNIAPNGCWWSLHTTFSLCQDLKNSPARGSNYCAHSSASAHRAMDAQLIEGLASTVEPDARRMVRERIIEEERRTAERASPRLMDYFDCVTRNGWINVTSSNVFAREQEKPFSTAKPFGTRNSVTPASIFRGLFDRSVQQEIRDFMINTFPINENTGKRRKMELLSEDIEKYAAIQLSEMHLAKPDRAHYRAWLNTTNFSISRDERVAKYIDADWDNIWKILNLNFESAIIPGGNSTVDETMLPWHGFHPMIVYIEGKPEPVGWKAVTMAVKLGVASRPYLISCIPEITKHIKPHQALATVRGIAQRHKLSVCGDRWFGRAGYMESFTGTDFLTFGMKLTEDTPLYTIMLHGLHDGQFRVFSNGKMLVSAYRGDSALIVATSNATTDVTDERRIPITMWRPRSSPSTTS